MKARYVVALVDTPSTKSQGMLALIFECEGAYYISGTVGGVRKMKRSDGDLTSLIRGGHALGVKRFFIVDYLKNPVAHWVGDEFLKNLNERYAPKLLSSSDFGNWIHESGGRFAIGEPEEIFAEIESWIKRSGLTALRHPERAKELVELMKWSLPMHKITTALSWYVAESEEEKKTELAWQSRILRRKEKNLLREFQKTIEMLTKEAQEAYWL